MLRKLGKTPPTATANVVSIIGADVRIVGDIITEGEMQIDGRVEGDITCKTLVIGPGGHIVGEIKAERVRIHGEVSGKLSADHITIGRTGHVTGDIQHDSLEIESGAQVEGHFLRKGHAPAVEQAALPKPGNGASIAMEAKPTKPAKAVEVVPDVMDTDEDIPATVN